MKLWHLQDDTPRLPRRPSRHQLVRVRAASWPVAPGQEVWVVVRAPGKEPRNVRAGWVENRDSVSYWEAELGAWLDGESVEYTLLATDRDGNQATAGPFEFSVGPKLTVALMWHQHQPLYRPVGDHRVLREPWVRLHALRDYFAMPWLLSAEPEVHATINLTPVLLGQLEDYVEHHGQDEALLWTRTPAEHLGASGEAFLLRHFFEAHWHNQIQPFERYRELFHKRESQQPFSAADLRDLQMWFNLAWFGPELLQGEVALPTGRRVTAKHFVERGRDFSHDDVMEMIDVQQAVMAAVLPMHRTLVERGQLEVATTPFYHPILPLLVDSDRATLDREGTRLPRRFAHVEDADTQVRRAQEAYRSWFGRDARGMWPAEGAVAEFVVPLFAKHGVQWIASDAGVLARSGKWGYRSDDPDVLCRPYRAEFDGSQVTVFFRDTALSDAIGFQYHSFHDAEAAAADLVSQIKSRFAERVSGDDAVLSIILDGENAWGAYRDAGRPFLRAMYRRLADDPDLQLATFSEVLDGAPSRHLRAHPIAGQAQVHQLFIGSWADELASAPGVDLGTWIGEEEENVAWEHLEDARDALVAAGQDPSVAPLAWEAIYAAEGSDWFWWYGSDQDSGRDDEFDALFRTHLRSAYLNAGLPVPAPLGTSIFPPRVVWSATAKRAELGREEALTIITHCPGTVRLAFDDADAVEHPLRPVGGVMAGCSHYELRVPPAPEAAKRIVFRIHCNRPGCQSETCHGGDQEISLRG
ncbi:MAG: glycoside hydrolase family 57 protein [Polyangiaceae bacterium]